MSTTLFSFRISNELKEKLDSLAQATQRSKSFLAAEAIQRYVEEEAWQVAHIQQGIEQADAGKVVAGEDVDRWLASWGTPAELPRPKSRRRTAR
jgi:RHH-type rel operon transcriptional repressor/antitoxin RelB